MQNKTNTNTDLESHQNKYKRSIILIKSTDRTGTRFLEQIGTLVEMLKNGGTSIENENRLERLKN